MFSHMFLLFWFLLLVFLRNCYLLFSQRKYIVHAPPCFWNRMRGFLKSKTLVGTQYQQHYRHVSSFPNLAKGVCCERPLALPCLSTSPEVGHLAQITILEFKSLILVLGVQVTTRFAVEEIFSYESLTTRKDEKLSTDELPTRFAVNFFFNLRVAQVKKAKDFCSDELHTRARTRKPLSPPGLVCHQKKGDMRKKRRRPRKVVCCACRAEATSISVVKMST